MVRDLDGKVLFWNKGAEVIYGWIANEVIGRKTSEFLYFQPEKFQGFNDLTINQGEWNGEIQHLNRAGDQITIEARWTLIRDKEGPSQVDSRHPYRYHREEEDRSSVHEGAADGKYWNLSRRHRP